MFLKPLSSLSKQANGTWTVSTKTQTHTSIRIQFWQCAPASSTSVSLRIVEWGESRPSREWNRSEFQKAPSISSSSRGWKKGKFFTMVSDKSTESLANNDCKKSLGQASCTILVLSVGDHQAILLAHRNLLIRCPTPPKRCSGSREDGEKKMTPFFYLHHGPWTTFHQFGGPWPVGCEAVTTKISVQLQNFPVNFYSAAFGGGQVGQI